MGTPPPPTTPAPTPEVPQPTHSEQIRQLPEPAADIHKVLGTIINSRTEFLPGELLEEISDAWINSSYSIADVVQKLVSTSEATTDDLGPTHQLVVNELVGSPGKLKRS